jgi:parallel beta-helix repeat protein
MVADPSCRRFPVPMTMGRSLARASMALAMTAAAVAVWAQPAQANPPCGATITANLVLTGNMACVGTAMVAGANNIVIDLNGFTVSGNGTGDGILVLRSRVTIRNGKLTGFDNGIRMLGAGEGTPNENLVSRVTALSNHEGIDLTDADYTTITDSLLQNNTYGVVLGVQSDRNRIVRTRILANALGILIHEGSDTNVVAENTIAKNTNGIVLRNSAQDNLVQGNTITGNLEDGVAIKGPTSNRNVVRSNEVSSNGVGVHVCCGSSLDENQIIANTVVSNAGTGILVFDDHAQGTVVTDNVVRRNGFGQPLDPRKPGQYDDGIHVESPVSAWTTIANNASDQNADLGIEASGNIVDGGGNSAILNGDPAQCVGVVC